MSVEIKINNAIKRYGDNTIIGDLSLDVREGEFFTLLGPSGCGKTTLLRMIAGFNSIEGGDFYFNDKRINDIDPAKRNIGMVFQNYAIFPHLTVKDNVAFGLKNKKVPKEQIEVETTKFMKLMHIDQYADRLPERLSGGQQQRVALARALVIQPDVLLMDEPLSNLDAKLRVEMRTVIKQIQNNVGITTVYVTHDQEEALTMSDTIVVMNQGYIQQIGTPEMIYNEPTNAFVADFIGDSNILDGTMIQDKVVEILGVKIPCVDEGFGNNTPVDVVIRPEDIEIVEPEKGFMEGDITSVIFKGVHYEIEIMANGFEWLVHTTLLHNAGEHVGINVIPFNIQIMNKPESEDEEAVEIDA